MPITLSWTIEGEKQLSRQLQGLSTKIKDLKVPFTTASDYLVKTYSEEVFSSQGGAIKETWARLSPYTVAMKAVRGLSPDILVGTGEMKNSFRSIVESKRATIYNDTDYFKYHQSNKPRRSNLPRRVMMKFADQQKEEVVRIFQKYIFETTF